MIYPDWLGQAAGGPGEVVMVYAEGFDLDISPELLQLDLSDEPLTLDLDPEPLTLEVE